MNGPAQSAPFLLPRLGKPLSIVILGLLRGLPVGFENRNKILDAITDAVGGTPMVRLSRFGRDLPCELLAKCEYFNPGGSLKDRIGVRMILDAEAAGRISPGDTLIEPTSGNTGIGMALTAAVKGYRMIITMPEKMSREKQVVLEALGAEIIRTPTEAAWDSPESHIGVAKRLEEIIPNSHILDQYSNESNPRAHAEGTAQEILEQTEGRLDAVVIGAGTGGTITGVARRLKEELPQITIVGADPVGSILAGPEEVKSYKVEGIGYDFIPEVLDRKLVDRWIKTNDREAFLVARQLIREEGLLVGGSSGSAAWAAQQVCREMKPGQRVVVILPDSVRNYMTKFVDDAWMQENAFCERDRFKRGTIGELLQKLGPREPVTVAATSTLGAAVELFRQRGISNAPVLDRQRLAGFLHEDDLLERLAGGRAGPETTVAEVMSRTVTTLSPSDEVSELTRRFESNEVAVVVDENEEIVSLLTKLDLIAYLTAEAAEG